MRRRLEEVFGKTFVRRGVRPRSAQAAADVVAPGVWVECKAQRRTNLRAALRQAAGGARPPPLRRGRGGGPGWGREIERVERRWTPFSGEVSMVHSPFRFGDVSPSRAARHELRWFFNEALKEVDLPSNFVGLLSGVSPGSLAAVERRAEAIHSARKIRDRLATLSTLDAIMLQALYEERPWPPRVEGALGVLTGPVAALPIVKAEHLRALLGARSRAQTVTAWLDELVAADRHALALWRPEAVIACAMAVTAYERARGKGGSVVPSEGG